MGKIMKSGIPYGGGGNGAGSVSELTDVKLTDLANGDTLQYDSTENKWKNEKGGSAFDLNNAEPTFSEASERVNIASGEKVSVILGKIKKFFTDLKPVAFSGSYSDLSNKPSIPTVPSASTSLPLVDGNATVGVSSSYARADHVHPAKALPTATSSVLGGVKIGENMTIEDGVINPSYLVVANKFNKADLYSTTEKVVGCWTDGKPIYQKTFTGTLTATSAIGTETTTFINVGASVDTFVGAEGKVLFSGMAFPISARRGDRDDTMRFIGHTNTSADTSHKNQFALINAWFTSSSTYYVTVQYTKTTDSANSFKYADENDYSTSEKIVGTWIDGSLLYQKTISFTTSSSGGAKTIGSITNLKTVVDIKGVLFLASAVVPLAWLYSTADASTAYVGAIVSGTNVQVMSGGADYNNKSGYVTIQYTKN